MLNCKTPPAVEPRSLRSNFVWTFTGNAFIAAGQWAILSLVAKLGDTRMLGEYALGFAVALPVAMFAHMNLRAVLATDVERRHPFGDYLAVRVAASAGGIIATAAAVFASGYGGRFALVTLTMAAMLACENFSDLYYGLMQRRERMDQVGRSMMLRAISGVPAFGLVMWLTRDLAASVAAVALCRVATLLAWDRPHGGKGESVTRSGLRAEIAILRSALPLGAVLLLVSLTTNLPRYAIERYLGTPELGAFAAVASALALGNTVVNALGQTAVPRLARFYSERDLRAFKRLAARLALLATAVAASGAAIAAIAGKSVLAIVYRPEYAAYNGLLIAIMGAAIFIYTAVAFGYVITSARSFGPQMPLLLAVSATSGIASWILVPAMGLAGAAVAIALAGAVQIAGQCLILSRLLRRAERHA